MEFGRAFGLALKEQRLGAGLTQEELAFRSEMHVTAISFYERGMRQPTLYTVFKLARILGIQPSALVRDVEVLEPVLN